MLKVPNLEQDPELGGPIMAPLFRYLIRYIAAAAHGPALPPVAKVEEEQTSLVLAAYQLLCYHISTSTRPAVLLPPCITELPLALLNIG